MTPGKIVEAGDLYLLVLYPLKGDSRRPCTVLMDEPYVSPDGIIDVVLAEERQFYLVPGIAMLQPDNLATLQIVGEIAEDQLQAIAYSPLVAHQVKSILASDSDSTGPVP